MPREYQKRRNNPYILPDNLYKMIKYAVKDYDRLKGEYIDALYASPGKDGTDGIGRPTEQRAIKRDAIFRQLEIIEQSLMMIPSEYRRGVFDEARYGGGFPIDAGTATYQRWKQRFIYYTAKNMNLI